jgi:hypothetical protein
LSAGRSGIRMPDIDLTAEIHISHSPNIVEVLIPMAGRPSHHWQELFREMAKTTQPRVAAHDRPERFWIQVQVPVDRSSGQVAKIMDDVRKLISKVNAGERSSAAVDVERAIRVWWTQQQ